MVEYVIKFLIGGAILVLATYFSKSKNLFFAGIITTLPLMTLANMTLQIKYLNAQEFQLAQKSGIFGAIGLVLFIFCCYFFVPWLKPIYTVFVAILIYCVYFWVYKLFS